MIGQPGPGPKIAIADNGGHAFEKILHEPGAVGSSSDRTRRKKQHREAIPLEERVHRPPLQPQDTRSDCRSLRHSAEALPAGHSFARENESIPDHQRRHLPGALPFSSECNSLPGLKRTALPGEMLTSVPVRGLRPMPVLRARTLKTPKPRNSMRSPVVRACLRPSKTVSTAASALVRGRPVRSIT